MSNPRRELRVKMGLCRSCGGPNETKTTMCAACCAVNNARNRARRHLHKVSRPYDKVASAKYRAKLTRLKLCTVCRTPTVNYVKCLPCRIKCINERKVAKVKVFLVSHIKENPNVTHHQLFTKFGPFYVDPLIALVADKVVDRLDDGRKCLFALRAPQSGLGMKKPRSNTAYATSLGISNRKMYLLGGMEKLQGMAEDARIMLIQHGKPEMVWEDRHKGLVDRGFAPRKAKKRKNALTFAGAYMTPPIGLETQTIRI